MKKIINQVIKFGIVGVIATIIDFVVLYILTDFLDVHYLISSIISFTVSVIFNYIYSIKWVFKINHKQTKKDFITFVILSIIGLCINELILYVMVDKLSLYYMISKIFATSIVMIYNFITRKKIIEK